MALLKQVELASGISGEYWRVTRVNINRLDDTAAVEMRLYLDAEARSAGKDEIRTEWFYLEQVDLDALRGTDPVAATYTRLKQLPEFEGAADA